MVDKKTYIVEYKLDSDTRGAKKAEGATEDLRKENEKLDKSFRSTKRSAHDLNGQLRQMAERRRELAQYLTTNRGDKDALREYSRIKRDMGLLQSLRNSLLPNALNVGASGGGGLVGPGGAFKMGSGLGPGTAVGLAGLAATAAPGLGAVLAGALSGTVVGGAMAVGIASAAKDSRVQAAAKQFGADVSAEFFGSGAFVQPVIGGLEVLKQGFRDMNIGDALAKAAPHVVTLADGIARLGKNMMPGFNKLLDRAGPLTKAFADGLGGLGGALGDFMDQISESPGALTGLRSGMQLLSGTIIATGRLINWLADIFHFGMQANATWLGWLEKIPIVGEKFGPMQNTFENLASATGGAVPPTRNLWHAFEQTAEKANDSAEAVTNYIHALQKLHEPAMTVLELNDEYQAGLDDLRESVKENGTSLSEFTEAGRENRGVLLDLVQTAQELHDANLEAGMSAAEADKQYQAQIDAIVTLARNLGLAEDQIALLVLAFRKLPGEVMSKALADAATKAKNMIAGIAAALSFGGAATGSGSKGSGGFTGFAHGGTTPAFEPFYTHPGEVMWSDKQHYVSTKAQTEALARSGGGMGGGGGGKFVLDLRINGRMLRELLIDDALLRGQASATVSAAYP